MRKIKPTIFKEFPEIINIFDINILKMIAKLVSTFVLAYTNPIIVLGIKKEIAIAYSKTE
jgi:hypothetical protein